jgi:hypothetical protein
MTPAPRPRRLAALGATLAVAAGAAIPRRRRRPRRETAIAW